MKTEKKILIAFSGLLCLAGVQISTDFLIHEIAEKAMLSALWPYFYAAYIFLITKYFANS